MGLKSILEGYRTASQETTLLDKICLFSKEKCIPKPLLDEFEQIEEKRKAEGVSFLLGEIIYSTIFGYRLILGHYPQTKQLLLEQYRKEKMIKKQTLKKIEGDCIYT